MAKPTAPLLSFGVSGQLAKTTVYGKHKGQPTAREHVVPENPKSAGQTLTRSTLSTGNRLWKQTGPLFKAPWNALAAGKPVTGYNKFIGNFIAQNRGQVDLANWNTSLEVNGGPPLLNITAVLGAPGKIRMRANDGLVPADWTSLSTTAVVIPNQAPTADPILEAYEGTAAPPDLIFFNFLEFLTEYWCTAWRVYVKPTGQLAYSVSQGLLRTTT